MSDQDGVTLFPWLNPQQQGREHEKNRAKRLGGRLQPGSGNLPGRKEDIRLPGEILEQTKWTSAGSFRLSAKDFLTTRAAAVAEGRTPQWTITFSGAAPGGKDLVLVVREERDVELWNK